MLVRVEKGSAVPISRQIADQVRAQCLSGRIKPGTQIPSVRQLARDLAVNQNTVLRVYEKLTAEKLLEMRHGEGTFVSNNLPTEQLNGQRTHFFDEMTQLVRHGRMLGINDSGLHALLDDALKLSLQQDHSSESKGEHK
ncbi:GntR family transcriptional regulator [Thalassoglobus polymorphus]|uniref:HTH-type transcriptional repressor YtrA n=1 Tax=Thalassoglobus polymorphus TaxID=2527994 RepID=A0A517QRM7_9PLAN|nr:GntR family transcriptional regulator [Thalassoglobus polymorphus]QDT34280.1 HTH-type transcriptional repressor YtrA [Thalassoglobus polymorphus]